MASCISVVNQNKLQTGHYCHSMKFHSTEIGSPEDCCGTSYAAKLLGLSVGTVQKLVEKNDLKGWKTQGGHRRISMKSIRSYLKIYNISQEEPTHSRWRVLIVEDDTICREMLRGHCQRAKPPIDCTSMSTGLEALMDMSNLQPDLLITDLDMPGTDGFELLRMLRKNPQFDNMIIMVLSAMSHDEIQTWGQLPADCIVMKKPMNVMWFDGFFAGLQCSKKSENQQFITQLASPGARPA
jgi:excisionase family DNA binding protein